MIIREIKENPTVEAFEKFDWFNDYKDTRSWAKRNKLFAIVELLDEGFQKWMKKQGNRRSKDDR